MYTLIYASIRQKPPPRVVNLKSSLLYTPRSQEGSRQRVKVTLAGEGLDRRTERGQEPEPDRERERHTHTHTQRESNRHPHRGSECVILHMHFCRLCGHCQSRCHHHCHPEKSPWRHHQGPALTVCASTVPAPIINNIMVLHSFFAL